MQADEMSAQDAVRETIRAGYAKIAEAGAWSPTTAAASAESATGPDSGCAGGCCGSSPAGAARLAELIGYEAADLVALPEGANLGLSCGNPTALASLRCGEVVLDLGCGAGFDCFVASPKVGATGRVIGVDMTPPMISRARKNLVAHRECGGLDNVEFRLGEIEHLPVADASVDVVISNCVLNLSPDKPQVWREIARVLRPSGRVAVSDLALLRPLPKAVRQMVEALVGCVAGAVLVKETRQMMEAAGLRDIRLTPKAVYVESMNELQDPLYRRMAEHLPAGATLGDYVTSLDIAARR